MKSFNNKDEELYIDEFKKNAMDLLLHDELQEELMVVKMSHNLKQNIMQCTIEKPKTFYGKVCTFLNGTIEIPVSYVCSIFLVIFISSTLSTFIITDAMKMDKKLQGYTNIRVLNISGNTVILPKNISEVIKHYEN